MNADLPTSPEAASLPPPLGPENNAAAPGMAIAEFAAPMLAQTLQAALQLKPGSQSTEFWIVGLFVSAMLAGMFVGKVPPDAASILSFFSSLAYLTARYFLKQGSIQALQRAASTAPTAQAALPSPSTQGAAQ